MRGVPHSPVPLVDAAPVRAQQDTRHLGRFRCFQAGHRFELRMKRPVGQVLEQGGGRGRVPAGPGKDPAEVLDQVGAGPGALFLLGQRDRLLRRLAQDEFASGSRAGKARAARARADAAAVPDRWRN